MKKIVRLMTICLTLGLASCNSWLDVAQEDSVMEKDLFESLDGFKMALNGVYLNMNSSSSYGGAMTMGAVDVLAQYYDCSNIDHIYNSLQNFRYEEERPKSQFNSIWSSAYQQIAYLNAVIEHCDEDRSVLDDTYYGLIKGEALGLRALYHFDMLRLFGPLWSNKEADAIPYMTSSDRSIQPLLPADTVVELVLADLSEAAALLRDIDPVISEGGRNESGGDAGNDFYYRVYRMNYFAVQALRARAALWKQDYAGAKNYAVETIQAATRDSLFRLYYSDYASTMSYDRIFEPEILFASYNSMRGDACYGTYFENDLGYTNILGMAAGRAENMYSPTDYRITRWWEGNQSVETDEHKFDLFVKYEELSLGGTTDTERWSRVRYMIPLFRLSELYLIAAECIGIHEQNVAEAVEQYLNPLRQSRNEISLSPNISATELRDYIENEYICDFVGEGQTFFYFKRNELSIIPNGAQINGELPIEPTQYYVIPLPDSEMDQRE